MEWAPSGLQIMVGLSIVPSHYKEFKPASPTNFLPTAVDCWREALRGIREETPARNSLEALDNFPLSPMIHIARPSCSGRPYDASQKSDHGLSITQQILEGKTDIQNVSAQQ